MDVFPVNQKILRIPNAMIGKSALPDFSVASEQFAELARITSPYELNSAFQRGCRSQQQMYVLGHEDERV
jgi:hypothetical protein